VRESQDLLSRASACAVAPCKVHLAAFLPRLRHTCLNCMPNRDARPQQHRPLRHDLDCQLVFSLAFPFVGAADTVHTCFKRAPPLDFLARVSFNLPKTHPGTSLNQEHESLPSGPLAPRRGRGPRAEPGVQRPTRRRVPQARTHDGAVELRPLWDFHVRVIPTYMIESG